MKAKIWPRDDAEKQSLISQGWGDRLEKEYASSDLASGDNLVFTATGISESPLLKGVEVNGSIATTHSLIMRAVSGTVRYITAHHNLEKKTIHLRSTGIEQQV